MEVEGLGSKAPAARQLRVEPGVVAACVQWAKDCADYRGYAKQSDKWRRGLKGPMTLLGGHETRSDYTGLAIGKVAEWYAAKLFGVEIDLRFLPHGDGGVDLYLPCGPSQVKNINSMSRMLVKLGSRELRFADWFIATKWNGVEQFVYVLGYAHRQQVSESPIEDGIGNWKNHVIPIASLRPIGTLLSIKPISEVL
jgi:hypothetical protein